MAKKTVKPIDPFRELNEISEAELNRRDREADSRWPTVQKSDHLGPIPPSQPTEVPEGTHCQEASPMSGMRYIPCGGPATTVVNNGDKRLYYMCDRCADHNLRNRAARIVFRDNSD